MNGYQKSLKTYLENSMIKQLKIPTSSGASYIADLTKETNKIEFYEQL